MTKTTALFQSTLKELSASIDADLAVYAEELSRYTKDTFNEQSAESMDILCDFLTRPAKRLRGSLAIYSYRMHGGADERVALDAARVMELLHAYLLLADDVYDRSDTRRGKPTAHELFKSMHNNEKWAGDTAHFGNAMAFNTGLIANHHAMLQLAKINVASDIVQRALEYVSRNLVITGEGQANDMYNEVSETRDTSKIVDVLEWKTAFYTFINPLQFGAILAGVADDQALREFEGYGLAAGRVFQMSDDIIGVFGNDADTGKSAMDDIKEGKRTLLVDYALQHADPADEVFLQSMLGNEQLTAEQFKRCKSIIIDSGALDYAKKEAQTSADEAIAQAQRLWGKTHPKETQFLQEAATFLLTRTK